MPIKPPNTVSLTKIFGLLTFSNLNWWQLSCAVVLVRNFAEKACIHNNKIDGVKHVDGLFM